MNRVILIGNLTRDPELSTTASGINYCRFSLAVQRRFTNADGEKEVDFINVVAWRVLADHCAKYLKKGQKAGVLGTLQTRSYENKDGVKVNTFEIVAEEVEFLSSKPASDEGEEGAKPSEEQVTKLQPVEDEDLPF